MVFLIVHVPWPISKGFGSFLFACLCFLTSMLYTCVSLSSFRLCHVWCPSRPCVVTSDAHEALFRCNHLGGIFGCQVAPCVPFPIPLCTMICLPCLLCHLLPFYASLHACLHVHAWLLLASVSSINTMKLWTSDPNLHLSPHRHHLLFAFFIVCLFAYFLVCLPSSSLAFLVTCHVSYHMLCLLCLYACLLYTHCTLSTHLFLSIACLLVPCLCLCMYTHGARTQGVKAWSNRHKKKGHGCKHVDMSQVAMFSRFRDLASPIWLCTLLNPLPSSLLSLLDGLY